MKSDARHRAYGPSPRPGDIHPIDCDCALHDAAAPTLSPLERVALQVLAGFVVTHAVLWLVDRLIDGPGAFALFGWAR